MNLMNQAKIYYNRYGFQVVPASGKIPLVPWTEYQTKKITEADIEKWWTEYPNANIACVTGALSGVCVLDTDGADLTGLFLPPTAIATTTEGHFHYYYRHPGVKVNNSAGKLQDGLDFRGDAGIIILPPSQHFDKNNNPDCLYTWAVRPSEAGFADIPDWLLEKVQERNIREIGASFDFNSAFQVEKGKRDDRLYRAACSLLAKRIPSKLTYQFLVFLNSTYNPPLDAEIVEEKFNQAVKFVTKEEND